MHLTRASDMNHRRVLRPLLWVGLGAALAALVASPAAASACAPLKTSEGVAMTFFPGGYFFGLPNPDQTLRVTLRQDWPGPAGPLLDEGVHETSLRVVGPGLLETVEGTGVLVIEGRHLSGNFEAVARPRLGGVGGVGAFPYVLTVESEAVCDA